MIPSRRRLVGTALTWGLLAGCAALQVPPPAQPPLTSEAVREQADRERYQAKIRFDPAVPQAITGFLRLGRVYSSTTGSAAVVDRAGSPRDLDAILDAVNEYTEIRAEFAPDLPYSDPRLLDLPIIIPQGGPNEVELAQLSRYLTEGGFVLDPGLGLDTYREGLEKYGGLVWGRDAWEERLADDHPLFSAYFRLGELTSSAGQAPLGIVVGGRLAVLAFDTLGKRLEEEHPGPPVPPLRGAEEPVSPGAQELDAQLTRELAAARRDRFSDLRFEQMVVNVVVYALTQEGSIAWRSSASANPR